ncbi:preprotein translocase subunit SecG [Anatilimnocola aggregata]|uniref:Protein-export membrane protein SecG n=1 Tax=Anatilimnocola aggregata TaxID=2528021 RepID=A0A517YIT4_9BACT|nr:preprotein translocase subunit SecG [Anatilimnocola aggregata]QDU30140.1 preprotein translocase subunit SecG [Anatilimnocola aggregata]
MLELHQMPLPLALGFMHWMFIIPLSLLSVFLTLLILVQRGRGGGLTGALGGMGGQSAFGTKAGDVFTKITVVVALLWIVLSMGALRVLHVGKFGETVGNSTPVKGGVIPVDDQKVDDKNPLNVTPAPGLTPENTPAPMGTTPETPKAETPKAEEPKTETPKTETPATPETPKTETPPAKTEAPPAESPKSETPTAESPKAEAPKEAEPKTAEPKGDAPKADAPKADEEKK